jgi:transcription elongation factor GreA
MSKTEYVTQEGYVKLQEELKKLESIERPKLIKELAEAREKGDLKENAEYHAAKEAQGMLELRISKLRDKLSLCRILDSSQLDHSTVSILSKVKIKNLNLEAEQIYILVPEGETDLTQGKISINTPIAKGLLGKKKGQKVNVELPNGNLLELEILEISA